MRLLLDTHVYLWWLQNSSKLPRKSRARIVAASEVYISSASIWEASIKASIGKLSINVDLLVEEISNGGFIELPVTARHAVTVAQLPGLHQDPFDRMLIAQAISEPLKLLTADATLKRYSNLVEVLA